MAATSMSRLVIFFVLLGSLYGCGSVPHPKREPLQKTSTIPGHETLTLRAPTNCIQPGELIPITLIVHNPQSYPLAFLPTFETEPPFDILLIGGPLQKWSETNQMPSTIDPVMQPGETRTYTWNWIADARYGERNANPNAIFQVFTTSTRQGINAPHRNEVSISVGIGRVSDTSPGSIVACAELPSSLIWSTAV